MALLPRETVLAAVTSGIAPFLGQNMARAAVRGQAARLWGVPGPVDDASVERLLVELSPGLAVFVGRAKAEQVFGEIRTGLKLKRDAR